MKNKYWFWGLLPFLVLFSFPVYAAGPLLFSVGSCLTTTAVSPSTTSALTIPPNPQNLLGSFPVNLQAGTSYAIVANDRCKFIKFSNAGAVAASLPSTVLPSGWMAFIEDRGAGGLTITPITGQIESASSFPLGQNSPGIIFSDGSNYHVFSYNAAAGSITINGVVCTVGGSCTLGAASLPTCSASAPNYACLNISNLFTAHQQPKSVALTDGATITPNGTDANLYTLTVAGNSHTLACPTTIQYGTYNFRITYSGSISGFTTVTGSCYYFPGGTQPSWTMTSGSFDILSCSAFDTSRLDCTALTNQLH